MHIRSAIVSLLSAAALAAPVCAAPLFDQVDAGELDDAGCRLFAEGIAPQEVEVGAVANLFGGPRGFQWQAPEGTKGDVRHVIAWRKPREIGSVLAAHATSIAVLKPGAAWPPDAMDDDAWEPLAILGRSGGTRLAVAEKPGTEARAIRVIRPGNAREGLCLVRITPDRIDNIADDGYGHPESEYTLRPDMGPPHTYSMANMLKGRDHWQNAGPEKDRNDAIPRAPISDVAPCWFILSWAEPRTVSALWLDGNARQIRVSEYRGPEGVHPLAGVDSEWKRLRDVTLAGSLATFAEPVTARALRVEILNVSPYRDSDRIAVLNGLLALSPLGDAALPEAVVEAPALPPILIDVPVEEDGTVSLVISDKDGKRIRNVTARQSVEAGKVEIPWDLNDEAGMLQGVGEYTWTALTVPKLGIEYQMTPYPNIESNSGNSPWLNGASGPGGWQADHSSPHAVCVAGDWILMGSPCCESGVAMIGCDLEGSKKWGHGNFMAWTGPSFIASDGKRGFAGAPSGADMVWSIPVSGGGGVPFIQASATADRLRGMRGLVADEKNLFMSVAANGVDVFARAATPADIDFDHTVPYIKPVPKPDRDHWDTRLDLARIFRLTGTPPGQNSGITYIETTDMPSSRQHMVLAFKRPVPLGSLAFPLPGGDTFLRLAYLKPDSEWPLAGQGYADDSHWTEFYRGRDAGWTVMALPEGVRTRALRITFDMDEDDMGDLFDLGDDDGGGQRPWVGRLDGMCLLKNRLATIGEPAEIKVSSGKVGDHGSWDALRDEPITDDNPGVYAMVWDDAQPIRGLAIEEIDGRRTEIDVYTGPAGEVDIADDSKWRKVASYTQPLRYYYQPDQNHNADARYYDGYVDFGSAIKTRAIRMRVCEQWLTRAEGREGCEGVRRDRGGQEIDSARCRIYGVAAVKMLDPEDESEMLRTDRIEVYDIAGEKPELAAEWAVKRPSDLALSPDGATLYAVSGTNVVAIARESGAISPLALDDLVRPGAIAVDASGALYVYDQAADRLYVSVYDPKTGKKTRTFGTPGGHKAGPWDPACISTGPHVHIDMAIDKNGKIWISEADFSTKRTTRWDAAKGAFEKEFLGNTRYGGGGDGCLDPWDKTKLYYADGGATVAYSLDWKTGKTKVAGITGFGKDAGGTRPIRVDGHDYLVTRPQFWGQPCGRVYLLKDGVSRLVAAVGAAQNFELLRTGEILAKLGREPLANYYFTWSDLDGDGAAQLSEVTLLPAGEKPGRLAAFDHGLGIYCAKWRFQPKEFLGDGTPVYEAVELKAPLAGREGLFMLPDGRTIQMSMSGHYGFAAAGAEGDWHWKTEGLGVHAYYSAGPYVPRQVVAEFDVIGGDTISKGGLRSFYATTSNTGTIHLWSGDGILFGRLFQDLRQPGRAGWAMLEHDRGMDLSGVTLGQEHFSGYLCRDQESDDVYVCAGHNHISVTKVTGLDRVQRHTGTIKVDAETVQKAREWLASRSRDSLYGRAPVIRCYRAPQVVQPDGDFSDWDDPVASFGSDQAQNASFRMGYDSNNLYLGWEVRNCGPFKNAGNDWHRLFKTGAAVDAQIGVDASADPARRDPVEGDLRILVAPMDGKPTVVLYQPIDSTAGEDDGWESHTMVFQTRFQRVRVLSEATAAFAPIGAKEGVNGYRVEAVIPLDSIHLKLAKDTRLRFDWGVQEVGGDGAVVMQRLYWANQSTKIVSDEAAEAQIEPGLWGDALFLGDKPRADGLPPPDAMDMGGDLSDGAKELFDDILGDDF